MKKKLGMIVLAVILFTTGCAGLNGAAIYNDDSKIAEISNSYNKKSYTQNGVGSEQVTVSGGEMSGMDTLWNYTAKEDGKIDITYLFTVESGHAKLVLIQPDDTVLTIVEISGESDLKEAATSSVEVKEGKNRIKLVAKSAKAIELEMTIEEKEQ